MEEQHRNIDEVFRQSLGDYREAPPGAVWNDIAARLDEEEGCRKGFFLRRPWIVLSLLLLAGSTWMVAGLNRHSDKGLDVANASNTHQTNNPAVVSQSSAPQAPITEANIHTSEEAVTTPSPEKPAVADRGVVSHEPVVTYKPFDQGPRSEVPQPVTAEATIQPAPVKVSEPALRRLLPSASIAAANSNHVRGITLQSITSKPALPEIAAPEKLTTASLSPVRHSLTGTTQANMQVPAMMRTTAPILASVAKPEPELTRPQEAQMAFTGIVSHTTTLPVASVNPPVPTENWIKPANERLTSIKGTGLSPLPSEAEIVRPGMAYATLNPAPAVSPVASAAADLPEVSAAPAVLLASTSKVKYAEPVALPKSAAEGPSTTVVTTAKPQNDNVTTTSDKIDVPATPEAVNAAFKSPLCIAALVGYDRSFAAPGESRYSASVRMMWQADGRISFGVQPAIRYGNLSTTVLSSGAIYQRAAMQIDSFHTADNSPTLRGVIDSIYNYVIREQFDSVIVKGSSVGGAFWEVEMPLMLQYKLNTKWYVYGGPSLSFGGRIPYSSDGETRIITTNRKDSIAQSQPLPAAAFNNYFGRSSLESYSNYKPAEPVNPAAIRVGYVAGFGYSWKRLLADASIHQQLSGYSEVTEPFRNLYSGPQVRLSIGYLLFEPKGNRKGIAP